MTTDATTPEQPKERRVWMELFEGDLIELGDEYLSANDEWLPTSRVGITIGPHARPYRRRINPASDNPDCVKQNADGLQQTVESLRAQLEEAKNRSKAWETVYEKEWKETCVHHTDSERTYAGCPVCVRAQLAATLARVAELEKDKERIDCFEKLGDHIYVQRYEGCDGHADGWEFEAGAASEGSEVVNLYGSGTTLRAAIDLIIARAANLLKP